MPSALNKVKARLRVNWGASSGLTSCDVINDGIGLSSSASSDLLLIGDDGDPETEVSSEYDQYFVDMAQTRRQENGTIPCAVIVQSGGTDQPLLEEHAFELLASAVTAVQADPTLGGIVYTVAVNEGTTRTLVNNRGTAIIVPFTVNYWAAI